MSSFDFLATFDLLITDSESVFFETFSTTGLANARRLKASLSLSKAGSMAHLHSSFTHTHMFIVVLAARGWIKINAILNNTIK